MQLGGLSYCYLLLVKAKDLLHECIASFRADPVGNSPVRPRIFHRCHLEFRTRRYEA